MIFPPKQNTKSIGSTCELRSPALQKGATLDTHSLIPALGAGLLHQGLLIQLASPARLFKVEPFKR